MTQETENLVLEHLRAIRADVSSVKDEIRGLRAEQTAMRHQMRAATTLIEQTMDEVAGLKVRLDRIERRLDLAEAPK